MDLVRRHLPGLSEIQAERCGRAILYLSNDWVLKFGPLEGSSVSTRKLVVGKLRNMAKQRYNTDIGAALAVGCSQCTSKRLNYQVMTLGPSTTFLWRISQVWQRRLGTWTVAILGLAISPDRVALVRLTCPGTAPNAGTAPNPSLLGRLPDGPCLHRI
jgi:hypothetical protein